MTITPLTAGLVTQVVQLHRQVLGDTVNARIGEWFLNYLYQQLLLQTQFAKAWVAVEDGTVVGFISIATDYQQLSNSLMQRLPLTSKVRAGWFLLIHPGLAWEFLQQRRFSSYLQTQLPVQCCYVLTLGVAASQQGKGIGRLLMDAVVAQSSNHCPIYLDTKADNHQAVRFYERYGFQIIDRRSGNVLCRLQGKT